MIRLTGVRFAYRASGFALEVEAFEVARGARVACIGPSGMGKSTLLALVAGILVPDSGRIEVGGEPLSELPDPARRARRLARVGMVFQELELLDYLSALDNVLVPLHLAGHGQPDAAARERASALGESLGIVHLLRRRPKKLSQGERQRVALARALVTNPELVLCDEPTGNLDPDNARRTLDLLFEDAERRGTTLLVVTHDRDLLSRFDRVVDVRELARSRAG